MSLDLQFPEGFWWGGAASGPQTEGRAGKKHKNIFDFWYDKDPEAFFNQVGPNITSDFYHTFREDLKMLKEIGLNSYRTSIQWTRLIKDFETGEADEEGAKFYSDVIDEIIQNGMIPVMNLHHFDLPIELYEKYGGWESKHVVDLFVKFAKTAFDLYRDRVDYWTTFNEPMVVVEGAYLNQWHYPLLIDGKAAMQVVYNLNLASAKTIEVFHSVKSDKDQKIGIILNLTPSYPRSDKEEDVKAAKAVNAMFNESFLDPAVKGKFPQLLLDILKNDGIVLDIEEYENDIIEKNTVDFLGVNYYQPKRVKAKESPIDPSKGWLPSLYYDEYEKPDRRMNPYRGWEIYPQCIYDIAINIRDNYKNIPWFLSENGMGVEGEERYLNEEGIIEDDYRIEFFKEHLTYLHQGIREGSNCFGFHAWTPIDCWSWNNAYKNRYGYISLDLETMVKAVKKSGEWMKEVSRENGF